jgi:hypothetical protein
MAQRELTVHGRQTIADVVSAEKAGAAPDRSACKTQAAVHRLQIHGLNGAFYICAGALLVAWPGATQTIFMERAFVGDEAALIRVMGLTVVVIGWLYLFGGRSGARQIIAASVVDRLLFVPAVLVPLAMAGVFPRLLGTFAILDPALGIGAWVIAASRSGVDQAR